MEDVQAAHRFLIKNADRYGIDPERIAAWGESAGGHLALILGLMPAEKKESLRLRGIVNYFGPTEFRQIDRIKGAARFMLTALIGGGWKTKWICWLTPRRWFMSTAPTLRSSLCMAQKTD